MYRMIVKRLVHATWRKVNAGDHRAAVRMAHPDVTFEFVGDTPLSGRLRGADAFAAWFDRALAELPGLRFEPRDVLVAGWPWDTRVAVRLSVEAPEGDDGGVYRNQVAQFLRLRWGRMVDDWVLEDTAALNALFARRHADATGGR